MIDYSKRITPEDLRMIYNNEVLVYATNMAGRPINHYAVFANQFLGARYGKFYGLQGRCFAIPTVEADMYTKMPIDRIKHFVDKFIDEAIKRKDRKFLVTDFAGGIGGWPIADIAALFIPSINVDNIYLPERYWKKIQELVN